MNIVFKTTICTALMAISNAGLSEINTLVQDEQLEITGLNAQLTYQLKLQTPNGELKSINFSNSAGISIEAKDLGISTFADGSYKYELIPVVDFRIKKVRDVNTEIGTDDVPESTSFSGAFSVKNSQSVDDQDETINDQQILDDLIVGSSLCVGQDCVNGENFGFDTIRLKENNLRIRFQDTSNSASFPSNDWELTANDSSNGGANRFSITDIDGGKTPFTVEAGARNNALYIDNVGKVGFGTNNPVVETHVVDGDTPTLRLEQNGTNGWTPQTWDMAGNESNFFIRDVTNGSNLPFRIQPGAPTNSLYLGTNSKVGFGTNTPNSSIHLKRDDGSSRLLIEEGSSTQSARDLLVLSNKGNPQIKLENTGTSTTYTLSSGNNLVVKNTAGVTIFKIDENGNVTIKGNLIQNGL